MAVIFTEQLRGQVVLCETGSAKKTSHGWKVQARTPVWPSTGSGAGPGKLTAIRFVKTKDEARALLAALAK